MPFPLLALGASLLAPIAKKVVGKILAKPVVKVAASVAAGLGISQVMGSSGGGLPQLPQLGGLPAIPAQNMAIQQAGVGGLPVGWKGAGGKLQMPWSDPRIPEYLKQFALDDAYLKVAYRAPKGYVVVRDNSGRPFAVNKVIAKQFGLWKAAAKPPISATDWKHYKRNQVIEKRLLKIAAPAIRHKHKSTRTVVVAKRKAA